MADDVDRAGDISELAARRRENAVRAAAAAIPTGAPGECEACGDEMPRLVGGRCAPCRDRKRRHG